jgi:hypothetical protein
MTSNAAQRGRDNPVRGVSMTLPHKPVRGGEAHADAIERLDAAIDGRQRMSQESESTPGWTGERARAIEMAEANEQVAAREAWLHYIELGY